MYSYCLTACIATRTPDEASHHRADPGWRRGPSPHAIACEGSEKRTRAGARTAPCRCVQEGAGEGAGEGRVDLSRASWKELVGSAGAARRGQEGREGADPVDEEWKNRALEARLQMLATTQVPTDMERVPAVVELIGRERFCVDVQLGAIASAFDRDAGPAADASPAQPRGASSGSVALPPGRPDRDGAGAQKSAGRMDLEEGSEGVRIAIELSDEDLLRMGLSASALQQISGGLSEAIAARVQAEMQAVGEGQELSEERVAELVSETVQEVAQRYRWHEDSAQPRDAAAPATSASPAAQSAEGVEAQAEGALERMVGQVVAPAPSRTTYRKLKPEWSVPSDPFTGLYLGTFGPHGPELLRLERGRDEDGDECVTATKVTGDVHVPAGEVSFQAKVGRNRKLDARGVYPEQLGIAARFKGRGRIADTGFKDPQWTEGELVQFTSSARREVTSGAELGFMWSIAHRGGTQRFLILLNRVNLDLERAWH